MSVITQDAVTPDEDLEVPPHLQSARAVLRRGLHESPELRKGSA